jgi:AcrR family transcriptional regulator
MTLEMEHGSARVGARRPRTHRGTETRRRVAVAAADLFSQRGYEGTSMQAIAEAAGVHPQTVYLAFGTKAAVLAEAAACIATDDNGTGATRTDSSDPVRQLVYFARQQCEMAARLGPLLTQVVATAFSEPDVAAFCEHNRRTCLAEARCLVARIEANGALHPNLSPDEAADILYTLASPDSYLRLVGDRGWTPERYEQWLADLLCDRLLRGARTVTEACSSAKC